MIFTLPLTFSLQIYICVSSKFLKMFFVWIPRILRFAYFSSYQQRFFPDSGSVRVWLEMNIGQTSPQLQCHTFFFLSSITSRRDLLDIHDHWSTSKIFDIAIILPHSGAVCGWPGMIIGVMALQRSVKSDLDSIFPVAFLMIWSNSWIIVGNIRESL